MDVKLAVRLGIGSFIGAVMGVMLNSFIPEEKVKMLLYIVVLLSGISILVRKDKKEMEQDRENLLEKNVPTVLALGIVTGAICSLSGAGGPVLVMPLLVMLGVPVRTAVGVALFDSVFIAIPSIAGYALQIKLSSLAGPLIVSAAAHGIGVCAGSSHAEKIRQNVLKKGIAVFSIIIAIWKLFF